MKANQPAISLSAEECAEFVRVAAGQRGTPWRARVRWMCSEIRAGLNCAPLTTR